MRKYFVLFILFLLIIPAIKTQAQLSKLQGMSQEELQKKAQAMGISPEQFLMYQQKLQQSSSTNAQPAATQTAPNVNPDTTVIKNPPPPQPESNFLVDAFKDRPAAASLPAFGYSIFNYAPSTFLPPVNVPTPTNYVFGPGDEVIITLWGETQLSEDVYVSKNGDIALQNAGVINVNGLSLEALKAKLYDRLSSVYASLQTGKTHINISTGQLRSVKIYVLGQVRVPGGYVLPSLSSAFTALYYCGGPTINGTLRDVEVLRGGKVLAHIDLYDYLLKGDQSKDVKLQDGDILFVPPVGKRVAIAGSVMRPGIYELKDNEDLSDLLRFASGLTFNTYFQSVHIERVIPFDKRNQYTNNILSLDLNFNTVEQLNNSNYTLDDGDVVSISSINNLPQNRVTISGDVRKPGVYELTGTQMTVRDLIFKADSLFPDAFLSKAILTRTVLSSEKKEILTFNLKKALEGDPANNLVLENRDEIQIYKHGDFFPLRSVYIDGAVKTPGVYPRLDNMTLTDLIIKAGGLTESATTRNIEITRMDTTSAQIYSTKFIVNLPEEYWKINKSQDFKLEDYDHVLVKIDTAKTFNQTVTLSGQVTFPGVYSILYRGEKLTDFIERAGGFKPTAYTEGIFVRRNNATLNLFQSIAIPDSLKFANYSNQPVYDRTLFDKEFSDRIPIQWKEIENDNSSIYNLKLMPGDEVVVPKYEGTITVAGDINMPSTVPFKKGAGLSYYIKQAGGYTGTSAEGDEVVILPNGKKWEPSGWFFIPNSEIYSGTTIFVPSKIISRNSDTWPIIRDIITVVSSTAVLILTLSKL